MNNETADFYEEKQFDGVTYYRTRPNWPWALKETPPLVTMENLRHKHFNRKTQVEYSDIDILIDTIQVKFQIPVRRYVLEMIGISDSILCRIRHNKAVVTPHIILAIHDATEMPLSEIREILKIDPLRKPFPAIEKRYCKKCHSSRKGPKCFKCGGETIVPAVKDFLEIKTPPVDRIRELAREVGYAIGVHGSMERDLDLIAAPWTDKAVSPQELIDHIVKGFEDGAVVSTTEKPLGRFSLCLRLGHWIKLVDLSICPRQLHSD